MACGASVGAGFPFAGQPDFFTLGKSFGDFNLNSLGLAVLGDGNGFFGSLD